MEKYAEFFGIIEPTGTGFTTRLFPNEAGGIDNSSIDDWTGHVRFTK